MKGKIFNCSLLFLAFLGGAAAQNGSRDIEKNKTLSFLEGRAAEFGELAHEIWTLAES